MPPNRTRYKPLLLVAALLAAAAATACRQTQAFILSGDAAGAEISYADSPAETLALARQHCAQFEKVPHLMSSGTNVAVYHCVPR